MADALSARQTKLLKLIIDEYITTAEPVGSETLDKKYNLEVSPATIRSEMAELTKKGYLKQPHTSAGRIPTPTAMKFYIDQLMEEKQMSLTEEVKTKENVMSYKDDIHRLMAEATHVLADSTKNLAVGTVDDGEIWHSGLANIFRDPDFMDLENSMNLFSFLDEVQRMQELFFQRMTGVSPIEVIFGQELGWSGLEPMSVVGTRFRLKDRNCALGVVGPMGIQYGRVIPVMKYIRGIMEEIAGF